MKNSDYQYVSPVQLWKNSTASERLLVAGLWQVTLIASIGLGVASIIYEWSGLPISFGSQQLSVTIYPPLIFCLLWVVWFGFWWGFIPAYLATLALAQYSGMPLGWSLLFAFADPLGLAVFAITYRAIPVSFRLRSLNSVLVFILLSFVSGIFGSLGSFIWTQTNKVAIHDLLPVWEGWWLGAFLQNLLFVAPLLWLFSPAVINWRNRHQRNKKAHHQKPYDILKMGATIIGGLLLYLYITIELGIWQLDTARASADTQLWQPAVGTLIDSVHAIYLVVTIVVLFFSFFGYQAFTHWTAATKQAAQELRSANVKLELLSRTDSLTGLFNRRTWETMLAAEFISVRQNNMESSLLLLDVDDFKRINDTYGHLAGDEVLRSIASCIDTNKRETDVSGRFGGEEFILVLPRTGRDHALKLAERLRQLIEDTCVVYEGHRMQVTASLGLAEIDDAVSDYSKWLAHADQALYQAKKGGRNRTVVYDNCAGSLTG